MNPSPFSTVRRAIGAILALLLAQAGAEPVTTVIRPSVAYTVQNLVNGTYQNKQPRLYTNGYSTGVNSSVAAVARMEFQISPAVLLGLKTIEFRAQQHGLAATDTGNTYLWCYRTNFGETTKELSYLRDGFTAGYPDGSGVFRRNLLQGFDPRPSILPMDKFGLMITTSLTTPKEVTFEDPQLVITYEPQPPNNVAAVHTLLTSDAKMPFKGETDPAIIGLDADPDQDGQPNFYELWLSTPPDKPSTLTQPKVLKNSQGKAFITLLVDKYADERLAIRVEASHNLIDWRDITATRTLMATTALKYIKCTDVVPTVGGQSVYFRFVALPEDKK